jgi:hypothetical protein
MNDLNAVLRACCMEALEGVFGRVEEAWIKPLERNAFARVRSSVTTKVQVVPVRLCHSRMLYVRAYARESQEMAIPFTHHRA